MPIINQLAPVNALVANVKGLVSEWRKPTLNSSDFASVLRERMRASNDPAVLRMRAEKARNDADHSAHRFMDLRDHDNDHLLSADESGLDKDAFARLDLNTDGRLSLDEIKKPALDAIARVYPGSVSNA